MRFSHHSSAASLSENAAELGSAAGVGPSSASPIPGRIWASTITFGCACSIPRISPISAAAQSSTCKTRVMSRIRCEIEAISPMIWRSTSSTEAKWSAPCSSYTAMPAALASRTACSCRVRRRFDRADVPR